MKVFELLKEGAVTEIYSRKTDKNYYKPGYDADEKMIRGTIADWMNRLGATEDDIKAAVAEAKKLPSYTSLIAVAKDISTVRERKNGTFSFEHPGVSNDDGKYHVYANGMIRQSSIGWLGERRPTRLKAPKPRLVAHDAVRSIVKIYDGAFKEVLAKAEKVVAKKKEAETVTEAKAKLKGKKLA